MWSKEEIQETLDEMKAECESQTERKHTELPWKAGPDVGGAIAIRFGDGPPLAVVRYSDNPAITRETAHANAELIELACNSHYGLLAVAERAGAMAHNLLHDLGGIAGGPVLSGLRKLLAESNAAIAKATP